MINRLRQRGSALYCDLGPYAGMMAVEVSGDIYLTQEEYARYQGVSGIVLSFPQDKTAAAASQQAAGDAPGEPAAHPQPVAEAGGTASAVQPGATGTAQ